MPTIAAKNTTMSGMLAQNQFMFPPSGRRGVASRRRLSHGLLARLSAG
jgi:hypothetical protein